MPLIWLPSLQSVLRHCDVKRAALGEGAQPRDREKERAVMSPQEGTAVSADAKVGDRGQGLSHSVDLPLGSTNVSSDALLAHSVSACSNYFVLVNKVMGLL